MGTIARQIAGQLPDGTVRTATRVDHVDGEYLRLSNGEQRSAAAIVVACDAPVAAQLLGETTSVIGQGVTCLYFAADQPPVKEPILILNGEGEGPVNNLCVPCQVAPTYAPNGQSLISVTTLGTAGENEDLESKVREQLSGWLMPRVNAEPP